MPLQGWRGGMDEGERAALRRRRWQRPAPARVRLRARAGFPPANRRPPRRPGRWPGHRARPTTACARRRSPGAGRIGRVGGGDLARMNQRLAVEALVAALLAGQRQARVIVQVRCTPSNAASPWARAAMMASERASSVSSRPGVWRACRSLTRSDVPTRAASRGWPAMASRRRKPTAFRTWPTREGRRARRPASNARASVPAGPGFRPGQQHGVGAGGETRASSSPHGVSSALMRATHSRRP